MLELCGKHPTAVQLQSTDCTPVWQEAFSCLLGYSGSFGIFLQNAEFSFQCQANHLVSAPCRYAWGTHPGGHWATVVASGIPFGLGAFVLFVSILFSLAKTSSFLLIALSPKLSSISYLIESYGAGAAASGKPPSFCFKCII